MADTKITPALRRTLDSLRGFGTLRKPIPGKTKYWGIRYSLNGQPHEETTRSVLPHQAVALLKKKFGQFDSGSYTTPQDAKTTFEHMVKLLEGHYLRNRRKMTPMITGVNGLRTSFREMRALDITSNAVLAHCDARLLDGYAAGTINRELAYLKRMFKLVGLKVVPHPPTIEMLTEDNTRSGFFERAQLDLLLKHLDPAMQDVATAAYITGWRVWDELLTRQWSHVDWNGRGLLRLDPGEAKSKDGRNFPMVLGLRELLERRQRETRKLEKATGQIIPWIFYRETRFNGSDATTIVPIRHKKWYYETWHAGCEAAGVDRIPHDFRRTAIRNLEMAGVPTKDAMAMVGHKTMSIYKRYAIADSRSMEVAAGKLDTYLAAEEKASKARVKHFQRR